MFILVITETEQGRGVMLVTVASLGPLRARRINSCGRKYRCTSFV